MIKTYLLKTFTFNIIQTKKIADNVETESSSNAVE